MLPPNIQKDEWLFSRRAWFSGTVGRWWLAPLRLTRSVNSPVTLGHLWWSWEKNSMKLKISSVHVKTILNKILKVPMFPPCDFADYDVMMRWACPQNFHCLKLLLIIFLRKIYLSRPQWVCRGLIQPSTPKSLPTPDLRWWYEQQTV